MMKMKKKVFINAEGGELVIRNSYDDVAVIPRKDAAMIKELISRGCYSCVDAYVSSLPVYNSDMMMAASGLIYPSEYDVELIYGDEPPKVTVDKPDIPKGYIRGFMPPEVSYGMPEMPPEVQVFTLPEVIVKPEQKNKNLYGHVFNTFYSMLWTRSPLTFFDEEEYINRRINNPYPWESIDRINPKFFQNKLREEVIQVKNEINDEIRKNAYLMTYRLYSKRSDDLAMRAIEEDFLDEFGYPIDVAMDGPEAVKRYTRFDDILNIAGTSRANVEGFVSGVIDSFVDTVDIIAPALIAVSAFAGSNWLTSIGINTLRSIKTASNAAKIARSANLMNFFDAMIKGLAVDYAYFSYGGKWPSELFGIENDVGAFIVDMFTPGSFVPASAAYKTIVNEMEMAARAAKRTADLARRAAEMETKSIPVNIPVSADDVAGNVVKEAAGDVAQQTKPVKKAQEKMKIRMEQQKIALEHFAYKSDKPVRMQFETTAIDGPLAGMVGKNGIVNVEMVLRMIAREHLGEYKVKILTDRLREVYGDEIPRFMKIGTLRKHVDESISDVFLREIESSIRAYGYYAMADFNLDMYARVQRFFTNYDLDVIVKNNFAEELNRIRQNNGNRPLTSMDVLRAFINSNLKLITDMRDTEKIFKNTIQYMKNNIDEDYITTIINNHRENGGTLGSLYEAIHYHIITKLGNERFHIYENIIYDIFSYYKSIGKKVKLNIKLVGYGDDGSDITRTFEIDPDEFLDGLPSWRNGYYRMLNIMYDRIKDIGLLDKIDESRDAFIADADDIATMILNEGADIIKNFIGDNIDLRDTEVLYKLLAVRNSIRNGIERAIPESVNIQGIYKKGIASLMSGLVYARVMKKLYGNETDRIFYNFSSSINDQLQSIDSRLFESLDFKLPNINKYRHHTGYLRYDETPGNAIISFGFDDADIESNMILNSLFGVNPDKFLVSESRYLNGFVHMLRWAIYERQEDNIRNISKWLKDEQNDAFLVDVFTNFARHEFARTDDDDYRTLVTEIIYNVRNVSDLFYNDVDYASLAIKPLGFDAYTVSSYHFEASTGLINYLIDRKLLPDMIMGLYENLGTNPIRNNIGVDVTPDKFRIVIFETSKFNNIFSVEPRLARHELPATTLAHARYMLDIVSGKKAVFLIEFQSDRFQNLTREELERLGVAFPELFLLKEKFFKRYAYDLLELLKRTENATELYIPALHTHADIQSHSSLRSLANESGLPRDFSARLKEELKLVRLAKRRPDTEKDQLTIAERHLENVETLQKILKKKGEIRYVNNNPYYYFDISDFNPETTEGIPYSSILMYLAPGAGVAKFGSELLEQQTTEGE